MKPRLLDLFCGAGGAAMGYRRAGFDVVGVDIEPQPNYPFEFHQADVLDVLGHLSDWPRRMFKHFHGRIHAVHASPPCQDYSVTATLHNTEYPRLIAPVRDMLMLLELPYVIENVEGARRELWNPVKLCGSSFGLGVRRHRYFEVSFPVGLLPPCAHHLQPEPIDVTGTGGPCDKPNPSGGIHRKPRNLAHAREVMGIDWMTRPELSEAVPPAYTEWLGSQLIAHLSEVAA